MSTAFWASALVMLAGTLWLYHKFSEAIRLRAVMGMYRVRDRLVFLVASGRLEEDNRVFQHYYQRANTLLQLAPNVGVDDILLAAFNAWKDPEDFNRMMARAQRQADQMLASPEFEDAEVCQAVQEYYRGVSMMILAHSDVLRVIRLLLLRTAGRLADAARGRLLGVFPGQTTRALKAVEYAEEEASAARRRCCAA